MEGETLLKREKITQNINDIPTYREKIPMTEEEAPLPNNQRKHIEIRKKKITCEAVDWKGRWQL